jgi:hypothetical protein
MNYVLRFCFQVMPVNDPVKLFREGMRIKNDYELIEGAKNLLRCKSSVLKQFILKKSVNLMETFKIGKEWHLHSFPPRPMP